MSSSQGVVSVSQDIWKNDLRIHHSDMHACITLASWLIIHRAYSLGEICMLRMSLELEEIRTAGR